MSEIKFKAGTQLPTDTYNINDSDIVMINNNMDGTNESESSLGSIYKGTKIVGTTKAKELCLTGEISVSNPVGNIISGDKLTKGMNIEDILIELLSAPIQYPSYQDAKITYPLTVTTPGSVSPSITDPYFSETVTYTYPESATCSATITSTKYKNGGDTDFTTPNNTTQTFYDAKTGGNKVASLNYSRSNGDAYWVATWGSSNTASQTLAIDRVIYGAPVMTSDSKFYIPLDSNGTVSNKTGKYDENYSAMYAVNNNGNEDRVSITVKDENPGASCTSYAYMPIYAGLRQIENSPLKIRSGDQLNLKLTGPYKGVNRPVLYIPYKYRIANSTTWNNVGKSEIVLTYMNSNYTFTIEAGNVEFNLDATSLEQGSVEVVSKYWLYNNGAWGEYETDNKTKSGVQFLKVKLALVGKSESAADSVKITITKQ